MKTSFSSPSCFSITSKFTVSFASLGGVPVFSLPTIKFCCAKYFSRPADFFSSILPPSCFLLPMRIAPFKKVPVVSTKAFAWYLSFFPTASFIVLSSCKKSIISSSITTTPSFLSFFCIVFS